MSVNEEIGVIVVLNGIVGNSTNRRIDPVECRGFVMIDSFSPFLFINNSDAEAANCSQSNPLVHHYLSLFQYKLYQCFRLDLPLPTLEL